MVGIVRPWTFVLITLFYTLVSSSVFCYSLDKKTTECEDSDFRRSTLKLIAHAPFSGLFNDLKNQTVFEASDIARVHGKFWVVFDSSMSLGMLGDSHFKFRGSENVLVGEQEQESQYEGIAYKPETDTFLLLHESWSEEPHSLELVSKPYIVEVKIHADMSGYDILKRCKVDFELSHENKGWEGLSYVLTKEGRGFILGLCEGNYCVGGSQGREKGNGRLIVAEERSDDNGDCYWEPTKTLNIPESAFFQDYSGLAPSYHLGKLALVSQEDSAVWVGDFDFDAVEFPEDGEGRVFYLPRDDHCNMVYCNAEGIQWIDDYRLVIVSDRAKKTQHYNCDKYDQSIHLFSLPVDVTRSGFSNGVGDQSESDL